MALPPWLPAPTPFEPRLQVGAWLTLWCWAGAPLLPALPWLGSLLSGCIGLAEASHGTTGGSSQALGSETCERRGQRVSTEPAGQAKPLQGRTQSCLCQESGLARSSKGSCVAASCGRTSSTLPLRRHSLASPKGRGMDREPSLTGSGLEQGTAACQPCPLVHGRTLRAALTVLPEVKHLCNPELKAGALVVSGPLLMSGQPRHSAANSASCALLNTQETAVGTESDLGTNPQRECWEGTEED